jgi:lysophospholipase L1-like esterase
MRMRPTLLFWCWAAMAQAAVSTNGDQTVALSANATLEGTVPVGHGARWSMVSTPRFAALHFSNGNISIDEASAMAYVSQTGKYVVRFTDTTDSVSADVTLTVVANSPGNGTVTKARPVRIMPLGDSITFGTLNEEGGGYRFMLQDKLRAGGYRYDFVGGRHLAYSGTYDVDHEGHSGWETINYPSSQVFGQFIDDGASGSGGYLIDTAGLQPDVVLLMLGTNDGGRGGSPATDRCKRLFSIIDDIREKVPGVRIIVAKIPPFNHRAPPVPGYASNDDWIREYNEQIGIGVTARQAQGQKMSAVDMYSALTFADLPDVLHPNSGGYAKMAQVWYDGIVAVTTGANQPPAVSLTTQTEAFTAPAMIEVNATASDSDGSVVNVEFFNGGTKLGEDSSAPYKFIWMNVAAGIHSLTVRATDNEGAATVSSSVSVTVNAAPNQAPTVLLSTSAGPFKAPASIDLNATANDSDGSVAKVEFFVGSTKLGEDDVAPYNFKWTNVAEGSYSLTAKVTDNQAASTTSDAVIITVIPSGAGGGSGGVKGARGTVNGSAGCNCTTGPWSMSLVLGLLALRRRR